MAYFTRDFIAFFKELGQNNEKAWFDANKPRYKSSVQEPFRQFVNDLIMRMNADDPAIMIEAKDAIFRIYRDVRFAKDKTPYKTHTAALISREGRKDMSTPGLYLQLDAKEVRIYGGLYQLDKDQLHRVRSFLVHHAPRFRKLIAAADFKKKYRGEILGDKNKRVPAEFREAAEKEPLIANKSFYYYAILPASAITSDSLLDSVIDYYTVAAPVRKFLIEALAS